MNKRKPALPGILFLACFWIICMSSIVHADTYGTIGPASNEQIVVERVGRQDGSTAYDTVAAGAELTSDVISGGGPMYNAAESVGSEVKNSLFYLKKNSKKNNVRLLEKVGFKKETAKNIANSPVKSMSTFGKNLDKVTKSMDVLDKWGTGWQVAGALAGDDTTGAKEAVNDAILSGASVGAGAWLGAKAGAACGAAGGPGGAALGGIVGAVGGAIAASYVYDTQVKTRLDKGAHKEVVKMLEKEEQAEKKRRRIRVDIRTVYPNGVMVSPENPLPPMEVIHQQAQEIREQRLQDRIEQATADLLDKCPLNPNKTKPGLCGCAVPETDSDGDLVPDCIDECPNDPKQYQAGPDGCIEKVRVPTVLGKPTDWAVRAIKAAGLVPAPGGGDPAPDKKSEFKIQSQNPVGDALAEPGSPVSIRIYSAYKPVIPNVIGLSETKASAKITAIGMKPVISKNKVAPTAELSGKVWSQSAPDGLFITLDVYKDLKEERCLDLKRRFWGAMADSKLAEGKEIISQARECDFYEKGLAKLKKMECLDNAVAFLNAMKGSNYSQARAILTANKHCDFHDEWAQKLTCQENLGKMIGALKTNDLNRYRALLVKSEQCGFYNRLAEAWNEGQKQAADQRKRNEQWTKTLGQFVGSALQEMASGAGSGTTTRGSNSGHASTTPVVQEGQCNDVRKSGANQPERHIIKLGSRGKTFVFDYETYDEEDRIIVTQGSRTLFDSGCVGTHGRKSVRLKKGFRSKVTVDVQPNCNGGTNTQWQFTVHCPD